MELGACGTAPVAPRAGSAVSSCARARPPVSALPVSSPLSSISVGTATSCSALSRLDAVPSSVPRDAAVSCGECVDLETTSAKTIYQSGFRKNRSTTDCLAQFEIDIEAATSWKEHTIAVLFYLKMHMI